MARTAEPVRLPADIELPERYEIRRRIATGGMASVWCAIDRTLGRSVAIKLLSESYAHDPSAVRRFKREARTAARLSSHRHVVTIYDVGESTSADAGHGRAFLVMEYLAGGTVADAHRVGAVNRREAVRWLQEAAAALDYAHSQGVVHRDIKPANFLLDNDRILHVADFGIARVGSDDTITATREMLGTAAYLAPERALGHDATEASDRYSLAVAAFELLAGQRPFTAEHFAVQARQHLEDEPPRASEVNPALPTGIDSVLARGLAKEPADRWPTATAFADAVELAMAGAGRRRRRAGSLAAGGLAAGAAATAAGAAASARERGNGASAHDHATTATRHNGVGAGGGGRGPAAYGGRGRVPGGPTPGHAGTGRPRVAAILAALVTAALVAGIAIANGTSGSSPSKRTASTTATTPPKARRTKAKHRRAARSTTSTTASAPATPSTTSSPATSSTTSSASALQSQGHSLMDSGNYSAAIPLLRQAVSSASPSSLTYAYALYDLGRGLRLSGDPQAAIPILYRRLQIPNQTETVRQELQLALQAVGQKYRGSGGTAPGPGKSKPGKGHGHGHGNGVGD